MQAHAREFVTPIDTYIDGHPADVQVKLRTIRDAVRAQVPEASEKISYGIPTFALGGNLFHFAAFKQHIGLYPGAAAIEALAAELVGYETSKGTIRVPLDQDVPLTLIAQLVAFNLSRSPRAPRRT